MIYTPDILKLELFEDFSDVTDPSPRWTLTTGGGSYTMDGSRLVLAVPGIDFHMAVARQAAVAASQIAIVFMGKFRVGGNLTGLSALVGWHSGGHANNFVGFGVNPSTGKISLMSRTGGAAIVYDDTTTGAVLNTEYVGSISTGPDGTKAHLDVGPFTAPGDYSLVARAKTDATIPNLASVSPLIRLEKTDATAATLSVDWMRFICART